MNLQYNSGTATSRISVLGESRPTSINGLASLDVVDTISCTQLVAANTYTKAQTDALLDTKASTVALTEGLLTRATVSRLVSGLSEKPPMIDSLTNLITGTLTVSTVSALDVSCGILEAGRFTAEVPSTGSNPITAAEIGSGFSYARFTHGHHLDSYTRGTDVGRTLYLNYYSNSSIRCGNTSGRLSVNCDPGAYQLEVVGTGRFSGALRASNFPSSSDARLKTDVESVSLTECTRLVKAVTRCTYKRIDMEGTPAQCGYIAQDWDRQLTGGNRCIMGVGEDANGPLLALDYSRIVPVLHGALLSALARIEALENRLT